MIKKYKKLIILFTAILLPIFSISSPDVLQINGISPCWPVIWLLPFSLKNGFLRAAFSAIFIGILMDSFNVGKVSYVPSLLFLSLLWSWYGMHNKKIELFLNIGLMAIFGTTVVGISIWAQKIILNDNLRNDWFHSWSIYVLISEVIITGIVAPLLSSLLLFTYKKN